MSKPMKGYKVFKPDWTCMGFKYTVGETFEEKIKPSVCNRGFHFCEKAVDCFNYYDFNPENKVAEVLALGEVVTEGNKSCTNKIQIVREIPWTEVLEIVNTGKGCSGNCNSGDCNSGDCNSGDWNSTYFSTGFFNSFEQPLYIFNKLTDMNRYDFNNLLAVQAMRWKFENNFWIYSENMTEEEKNSHPEHETTGGYLKTVDYKTACSLMWENMTDNERAAVKDIPNFDADVFEVITGIKI